MRNIRCPTRSCPNYFLRSKNITNSNFIHYTPCINKPIFYSVNLILLAYLYIIAPNNHPNHINFSWNPPNALRIAEGESELVSEFNIEYGSSPFALIFIAEYINILLIRIFTLSLITINHSNLDLILKTTILSFIFIWTRRALPRLRYDILIHILWKKFFL